MYASMSQTIESVKSRVVFKKRSLYNTPMKEIHKKMKDFQKKYGSNENIEEATTLFYLSNHGFHCIESSVTASEKLSKEKQALAEEHITRLNNLSLRMFYYLLVICAEEAAFGEAKNDGLYSFIQEETSEDAAKWIKGVLEGSRGDYFDKTGNATLGECMKAVEMTFRFARWHYGYGGLPWAQITQTAREVIEGHNSLELMIDHAFTLCHNNGAIFNKGHYFSHYKHEYYKLLDIQASGQIPAAIHSKLSVPGLNSKAVVDLHQRFAKIFPDEFKTAYDPSRVKSMEKVREAKAAALSKKAAAFISAGGGHSTGGTEEKRPPTRACDNLITMDQFDAISKPGSGFF